MDGAIVLLLVVAAVLAVAWPDFRNVEWRALRRLEFLAERFAHHPNPPPVSLGNEAATGQMELAKLAHHVGFQMRETHFGLQRAQEVYSENGKSPAVLALLAYYELLNWPDGQPNSPDVRDASMVMEWICQTGLERDPKNSYFVYCRGAKDFLLNDSAGAVREMQNAVALTGFNSYLADINQSEASLNSADGSLPWRRPYYGLDGAHPFNAMSLWVADATRTAAKKYNQEKAIDLAMLHLSLGERIWSDASSVRQAALGREVCVRVLRSLSKHTSVGLGWRPLADEFYDFLEDIGERERLKEYRDSLERLERVPLPLWLKKTRWARAQLASEALSLIVFLNAVVIASLGGWLVFLWRRGRPHDPVAAIGSFVAAVAPGTFFWSSWIGGLSGSYLFLSLAAGSILWVVFLLILSHWARLGWSDLLRSGFRGLLLGALMLVLALGVKQAIAVGSASRWLQRVDSVPWAEQGS